MSLYSLRMYNADARVLVVCDRQTYDTLSGPRSTISDYANEIIPVEVPAGLTQKSKSRHIKTNLRSYISGNYLYIDLDTIICSSLEFVDTYDYIIAAVAEENVVGKVDEKSYMCKYAAMANVDIIGRMHYNSGVLYVQDCPESYKFYSQWSNLYYQYLKSGVDVDQLSFLKTAERTGVVSLLPNAMNCQMMWKTSRLYLPSANIIHLTEKTKEVYEVYQASTMSFVKETGRLSEPIIDILKNPKQVLSQRLVYLPFESYIFLEHAGVFERLYYKHPLVYALVRKSITLFNMIEKIFAK